MDDPKILIIEDDKNLCQILQELLEKNGIKTDIAYDGKEGISLINKNPYAVVVLDLMIPNMSGMAIMEFIKEAYPNTKVIITTGAVYDEMPEDNEALEKGKYMQSILDAADAVMIKPYAYNQLVAKIEELTKNITSV